MYSRTELLQRELGRLNSRLCCTVLALERATSKAICHGSRSAGVVATAPTRSGSGGQLDLCCASGLERPAETTTETTQQQPAPAAAATSESMPEAPAAVQGVCEEWLNSQPEHHQQHQQEAVTNCHLRLVLTRATLCSELGYWLWRCVCLCLSDCLSPSEFY